MPNGFAISLASEWIENPAREARTSNRVALFYTILIKA